MGPEEKSAAPRRRGRTVAAVLGAVVVVLLAAGVVLTLRDSARPVTVEEARRRTTTSSAAGDGDAAATRPTPGIYRYEGSGTERLSTPPLSQDQGPTMPATVEWLDDGCWTFRIDHSSNHWQSWTYCPGDEPVVETAGETWQRWMIGATAITNLSTFECTPGSVALASSPTPGQEWPASCSGTSEAVEGEAVSAGVQRYVGEEDVEVGGTTLRTQHFVSERTMTGAQRGTDRSDVWFELDSGLPVRNERSIQIDTDTPLGTSTYTEEGSFRLVAVDPVDAG